MEGESEREKTGRGRLKSGATKTSLMRSHGTDGRKAKLVLDALFLPMIIANP